MSPTNNSQQDQIWLSFPFLFSFCSVGNITPRSLPPVVHFQHSCAAVCYDIYCAITNFYSLALSTEAFSTTANFSLILFRSYQARWHWYRGTWWGSWKGKWLSQRDDCSMNLTIFCCTCDQVSSSRVIGGYCWDKAAIDHIESEAVQFLNLSSARLRCFCTLILQINHCGSSAPLWLLAPCAHWLVSPFHCPLSEKIEKLQWQHSNDVWEGVGQRHTINA